MKMISYEGQLIRLRPIRKSDMAVTIQWRNNPRIRENVLGYRFPVTEVMEEHWYDTMLKDPSGSWVVFAVETLSDQELVGLVRLNQIDWISRKCTLGVTIGEEAYHGKGLGEDSVRVMMAYAFDCLNLRKICLEVVSYNDKALRLYHKLGFVEEGILKNHTYLCGNYYDVVLMSAFKPSVHGE
ncbi:MAG TPA: GNAT family protein [Kiritimatiellia bacterium]|nr:GNAT family protein [Kiritimatiellia bacterium]